MRTPSRPRSQGFTLIELLVVISIIAILAGMLLPAINMVRQSAYKANCGSNQRQMLIAMATYQNDNDSLWPVRPTTTSGAYAANDTTLYTAVGSLEWMAYSMGGDLTPKIFGCPAFTNIKPKKNAGYGADGVTGGGDDMTYSGTEVSAWAAAMNAASKVDTCGYTYDFMVPSNASSSRVIIGDRPVSASDTSHKTSAQVGFADGHVGSLNRTTGGANAKTQYNDGTSTGNYTYQFINKDSGTDNVYDSTSDYAAGSTVPTITNNSYGVGSTTSAFLR